MNIDFIDAIPLCRIFGKLKLYPLQESTQHTIYPSPFCSEASGILKINHQANTWSDSSTGNSGGPPELIAQWLHSRKMPCSFPDVQKWFRFNIGYPDMQDGIALPDNIAPEVRFAYKSPILNPALIKCIEDKGIAYDFARKHLRQIGLTHAGTGEEFSALGLKTEESSWWVYSPYISTFTGARAISFIQGRKYKFRTVHIFRDIFDYLSAKIIFNEGKRFDDECIILNTYECLENSAHYIRGFGYRHLFSWLSNDANGKQATDNYTLLCNIEHNLRHTPMNKLYNSCPDVNSWHVQHRIKLAFT